MKVAIYPGSFDPITSGHLNIIRRAANIFDKLIVCVMVNGTKSPLFSQQERVRMLSATFPMWRLMPPAICLPSTPGRREAV